MSIITYPSVPLLDLHLIDDGGGYYPNKIDDFVVGRAPAVNNVRVDLWEGPTGTYVFPAAPIQMQVVSSSASDTGAGIGCQQVQIHYLDTNYAVQTTTVTLNGVTPVLTTPTNILRVNGFHSIAVGTNGVPVGNVSLQAVGGAVTYAIISAGFNMCRQAIYTIPAGNKGHISQWTASSGTTTGQHFTQISLRATSHGPTRYPGVFLLHDEIATLNNGISINFEIPITLPPLTDVKVSAISDSAAANAVVSCRVDGWFEPA